MIKTKLDRLLYQLWEKMKKPLNKLSDFKVFYALLNIFLSNKINEQKLIFHL